MGKKHAGRLRKRLREQIKILCWQPTYIIVYSEREEEEEEEEMQ